MNDLIPEMKRFIRYPRKRWRWRWNKKRRIKKIHPKTIEEAFKMYEFILKKEVEYERIYHQKQKDDKYYILKGWKQCLNWLTKLNDIFSS